MKKLLVPFLGLLSFLFGVGIIWAIQIHKEIKSSLEQGWFSQPVQIYTGSQEVRRLQKITLNQLINRFESSGWKQRAQDQSIVKNEFTVLSSDDCEQRIDTELQDGAKNCLIFQGDFQSGFLVLSESEILEILNFSDNRTNSIESFSLGGKLFAQFIEDKAVRQTFTPLSQMPDYCLESILAIEDDRFLEHKGVSPRAIFRAFFRNIKAGRLSEGGSTITQQLIKNKFLNNKKTLIRKAQEAIMSILIELTVDKNKILESYLNIIYMGQDGPFEVRGFPAAAEFYFNKTIDKVTLKECASLAGSVKGPGIFGPHKVEKNKVRTKAVLDRMKDLKWITAKEHSQTKSETLSVRSKNSDTFLAPYFVNAVNSFIKSENLPTNLGLKVYTTLSPDHQRLAETTANQKIKDLKSKVKNPELLENLIVSANPKTGEVLAIVGGSNFQTSPYNRALLNFRPIGSLMKPFVYLSALINDKELKPTTLISNAKFEYKDNFKTWSPTNYDKSAVGGSVYLFQALMLSLNIPTARVGLEHTDLDSIIKTVDDMGVKDRLKPYPALILGTFEFYPLEVLQIFSSLSQFGDYSKIHFIKKVEKLDGEVLYEHIAESKEFENKKEAALVVGMLKNTLKYGTAKSALSWNLKGSYAGKTGTTSFHKDSWFAGFSQDHVAISWVGYDQGTGTKLSGAGHALPIWLDYIKKIETLGQTSPDFIWPDDTKEDIVSTSKLTEEAPDLYIPLPSEDLELVVEDKGWF